MRSSQLGLYPFESRERNCITRTHLKKKRAAGLFPAVLFDFSPQVDSNLHPFG